MADRSHLSVCESLGEEAKEASEKEQKSEVVTKQVRVASRCSAGRYRMVVTGTIDTVPTSEQSSKSGAKDNPTG